MDLSLLVSVESVFGVFAVSVSGASGTLAVWDGLISGSDADDLLRFWEAAILICSIKYAVIKRSGRGGARIRDLGVLEIRRVLMARLCGIVVAVLQGVRGVND